jgi:hypothetical protein
VAQTVPPVLIELQLETARIAAQMQQLTGDFQNFGKTVEKQTGFMANFKAAAAGVFAGDLMTSGLNLLKSSITGAIADAQAYEKAVAQLNAGLKSTGNAAGLSVEGLKAQASALEELSSVDENLIMQSQALFQTFTNVRNVVGEGNDIFDQASMAALNLSTKMGGDLQGATIQLGKALNDPIKGITALTRVGVVFTEAQKKQIKALQESGDMMGAQKVILAEMEVEFGGAAAAAGDTFAGAVARAKDKVSDFGRNIVTNLQPILLSIGKTIGDLYNKYLAPLLGFLNKNKEAVLLFAGVILTGIVALKLYNAILLVSKGVQTAYAVAQVLMKGGQLASIASTNGLAASMLRLNAIMYANPIGLIVLAVAALAAGFVYAWNNSETFRKIIINVAKAVLTGVGFMIRTFGGLIEIIAKVYTGPLRILLTVLSKLPGVGKYAKAGLDIINTGIGMIGDFADKTADKVEGFKTTLDGLADKKITIPGFGGKAEVPTGTEGADAPGSVVKTKEQIAAEKAAAKERVKNIEAANKEVVKIYGKMNDVIADGQKAQKNAAEQRDKAIADTKKKYADLEIKITQKKNDELAKNQAAWDKAYDKARDDQRKRDAKIESDYTKRKASIEEDYLKKKADLNAAAQDKIAKATESAANKQASIVQKSIDRLTSAFATGTATSISEIFKDGAKTADDVIEQLKTKLVAAKELQANAGALAAAGYSQVFIEDIVKQGPVAGNEMAKALLNASAGTQTELQSLYAQVETISDTGLNDLANTMNAGAKLATQALIDEYKAVPKELAESIAETNNDLTKALGEANANYLEKLAEAATIRNEALAESKATLTEALAAADETLAEANKSTLEEFNKAIKENKDALAEKLKEIQIDYDDAIAAIAAATKEKLDALQNDLQATIDKLKALGAAKDAALAAANSPASTYIPPKEGRIDSAGNVEYYDADKAKAFSAVYNYNTNVTGVNMADPNATARVVDNTVRFGATQGLGVYK